MKFILGLLFLVTMCTTPAFAGFQGFDQNSSVGLFNKIQCDRGVNCTKNGDKLKIEADGVGALQNKVTATATTITSSQCGSTFVNGGAVQIELPEASAVIGCRLTFVTANASNFDINPDNADQILVATNAAGDAIRNATLGNSITIEAISASQWAEIAIIGTWTDIN